MVFFSTLEPGARVEDLFELKICEQKVKEKERKEKKKKNIKKEKKRKEKKRKEKNLLIEGGFSSRTKVNVLKGRRICWVISSSPDIRDLGWFVVVVVFYCVVGLVSFDLVSKIINYLF